MNLNYLRVGDGVKDSPIGSGLVTGFSDAGYPQVDHVAVAWLERVDGKIFDPLGVRDKHIEERKENEYSRQD